MCCLTNFSGSAYTIQLPCTRMDEPLSLQSCLFEVLLDMAHLQAELPRVGPWALSTATERSEGGSANERSEAECPARAA